MFKKIATLFAILLWAGGIISGLVLTIKASAFIPAVAIVVLGVLAFPTIKRLVTEEPK